MAHGPQVRSEVGLPALVTRLPGAHVDHAAQLDAFLAVLYELAGQAVQLRSRVALPVAVT